MNKRNLQPKRSIRSILLVLLLCAAGMTKSYAVDFDFSAVCSTGQTLYYRITNTNTHEVQLTYPNYHYSHVEYYDFYGFTFNNYTYWYNYSKPIGDIIIPDSVVYNGIYYSVTSIRDNTFGDHRDSYSIGVTSYSYDVCSDINSIVIPSSVTNIGNDAFARCSGLTSVALPYSISFIGDYAFCNCLGLNLIVSLAETPPVLGINTYYGVDKSITINVPCGSIESYQSAQEWSEFTNFIATGPIESEVTETACDSYIWNETSYDVSGDFTQQFSTIYGCDSIVTLHLTLLESTHNVEYANECESYMWHGEIYTTSGTYVYEYTNEDGCLSTDTLHLTINYMQENFITSTHAYAQKIYIPNEGDSLVQVWWNRDEFATCEFNHYLVYRTNCDNNGPYNDDNTMLLSTIYSSDTSYFDTQLPQVEPGLYKYGISAVSDSITTEIVWSDLNSPCVASTVEIIATANIESGGIVIGYGEYNYGTMSTLTAMANEGYTFINWTENGEIVSTEPIYSFTVTENRTLMANFNPLTNHWTAESYQNNMFMVGVIMIDGIEQASPTLELGAFCNGECRGSELSVLEGGQWLYFVTIGGNNGDEITFRLYDHAQQQELNLYCFNVLPFEMYGLVGMDEPYEVLFASTLIVSANVCPEDAGTTSGTGEYELGTNATLTAISNPGYLFNSWTMDGEIVSMEPSYTFTVVAPVSFTANFDVLYSVSVNVNIEGAGTVTGTGEYLYGTNVTLTATANEGYAFNNWTLDGEIVSAESTYTFTVTGSVSFTANFDVVHSQQLASGWNWFSTFLDITLDDLKAALVEALPGTAITIMSQTNGNTTYNAGRWRGTLNALDAAQMYMIKTNSNCEITLTGVPINPTEHPALIHNGFNWIAFPFSESKSLNEAFAGFAVNGDMVMSQFNSAVYYGSSWRGALGILEPGQGYMYKSNVQGDRTFTFPISTK